MDETPAGSDRTIEAYLNALSSGAATPGGGSAAAYAGALGTSLIAMVARLTKPGDDAALADRLHAIAERSDDLGAHLAEAAVRDEAVYASYRAAASLPRNTDDEKNRRKSAMQSALK